MGGGGGGVLDFVVRARRPGRAFRRLAVTASSFVAVKDGRAVLVELVAL
jgi:hypothetical protein